MQMQALDQGVIVLRGKKRLIVNFEEQLTDPTGAKDFIVMPDDRIVIPRPTENVTILGGVKAAGQYPYKPGPDKKASQHSD